MTSVKSPSPGGAEGRGGIPAAAAAADACPAPPSIPAAGFPPPPGCLCDPLNPPNAAVHVPTGSAPMGCEKSGSADGTPRK